MTNKHEVMYNVHFIYYIIHVLLFKNIFNIEYKNINQVLIK